MRKLFAAVILMVMLCSCSSNKVIEGKEYETYGLLNADDVKDDSIKYEPCWGNIIWGSLLIESVIGPIYFFGFDMFEPVGKKEAKGEN